jgi:hypothetical protein
MLTESSYAVVGLNPVRIPTVATTAVLTDARTTAYAGQSEMQKADAHDTPPPTKIIAIFCHVFIWFLLG